jgi:FtsP/CotA-like multicopper oxidase with cupredoxin domain
MTETTKLDSETSDLASAKEAAGAPTGTGLTKFVDPLRIPPVLRPDPLHPTPQLTIEMQAAHLRLHSELPPVALWTYSHQFPGPTIEVRRRERVRVIWSNKITGPYPVVDVAVTFPPPPTPQGPFPQPGNTPGRDGAEPNPDVAKLPPWTAVHLHGGHTGGTNDGLPENAVLPGDSQIAEYPNDQPATALWYHDHAMNITRLNVMSGLVGMYLIRDDEEDGLQLPSGRHEVPLILCDRNLDTDSAGRLTGRLLHKLAAIAIPNIPTPSTLPFFGPYTLVNGVIWPHFEVEARWYRFRVLNASNARIYRLFLLDEHDKPLSGVIKQIGTDSGLLPTPVPIKGELALAPAERADILIDFSAFRSRNLRLVSTGAGAVVENPATPPGQANPEAGLPEPDVMQFRVSRSPVHDKFVLPDKLSRSFQRLTHDSLPSDHPHRWIVSTPPGTIHSEIWEMAEVDPATVTIPSEGVIQIKTRVSHKPGYKVVTLQRVARRYEDGATFSVELNGWEQWKFLNLGGPPHPMHIHLIRFQALSREIYKTSTFDPVIGGTTAPIELDPDAQGVLQLNEQGWKDTIRVGGNEVVSVAGQFRGGTGRFVYHCHILEHEDEGMMRPFLVMPKEVMAMGMDMHGGDHHK